LANLTADKQRVKVDPAGAAAFGIVLDEASFERCTLDPVAFQSAPKPIDTRDLTLSAYAVALICINDR
jgi:hypothetical protein